eukprot:763489-Hanusia_phi.AAC.2
MADHKFAHGSFMPPKRLLSSGSTDQKGRLTRAGVTDLLFPRSQQHRCHLLHADGAGDLSLAIARKT